MKIAFTSADGKPQTVYYFSTDVSYGSYLASIPFYGGRYYQRQLPNLFQLQHAKPSLRANGAGLPHSTKPAST